jgi:hypothetical protein
MFVLIYFYLYYIKASVLMVVVCQYFSEIPLNIHQTNSRSHRTRACRLRHAFNSHGPVAFITEPVSPAIVALHALGTAVGNIGRRQGLQNRRFSAVNRSVNRNRQGAVTVFQRFFF